MKEDRTQTNAFETFRKSLIPAVFTVFCLLVPFTCFATDFAGTLDGVTITDAQGTNAPPTASFIYTVDGNTVTFDASGSSDSDGTITEYKWDFGDGFYGTGAAATHVFQNVDGANVTLSVIEDKGGVAIVQQVIKGQAIINFSINFQPENAEVPLGYIVDSGKPFDTNTGYGWKKELINSWPKDRNNPESPNQAYDTFFYVSPSDTWEITVPNGTYSVTMCVGEPSWPSGRHSVQANGTPVVTDQELNSDNQWAEETAIILVANGILSITFEGCSDRGIPTWIHIETK